MRSEDEIFALILNVAKTSSRIRAVLLNGSRANQNSTKDRLQDFDITYIVTDLDSFVKDHSWIDVFGERMILQLPDEMTIGERNEHTFSYLMLFKDGNRIDLTLFPLEKLKTNYIADSVTVPLLDKDNLFENLPAPSDEDYHIKRPREKEFLDCCNEFWWVSTYIAKGLYRNEIIYAKEMMEIPVRTMFLKIIEWYVGVKTEFTVSVGKSGRNLKKYILPELYKKILSTYPDGKANNIWNSLFAMTELFGQLAREIAASLNFTYNNEEEKNVKDYLKQFYTNTQKNFL